MNLPWALVALVCACAHVARAQMLPNFIRSMNASVSKLPLHPSTAGLVGVTHYRNVPAQFPKGMEYQFDGLTSILAFRFEADGVTVTSRFYESDLFKGYSSCIFEGSGTGPTLGTHACVTNPGVNLLPLNGQLWLTIDTVLWGRMDLNTLDTLPGKAEFVSTVLNAHPACDLETNECLYVERGFASVSR